MYSDILVFRKEAWFGVTFNFIWENSLYLIHRTKLLKNQNLFVGISEVM